VELKTTALYDEHVKLGALLAPFGGWMMPIQYCGIIAEHNWTRQNVSLFDICHMGEFIIEADPQKSNLERIVTVNLSKLACGKCGYGFMLNEKGGIIDDLVVYRIEPKKWMLVVNAATTDTDELNLRKYLSLDSKIENVSSKLGKLDLQGPGSCAVLKKLFGFSLEGLKYYQFRSEKFLGEQILLSRTGYTGELGFELYLTNEKIKQLWNYLLGDSKVRPAGLGARDTLRLEMGYPLYGQDINQQVSPLEAGMEKFLDFDKDFIGKDALCQAKKNGANKQLVCFMAESRRAPRHNFKIISENKEIGIVSSGSFSPSLSLGIGMGYVQRAFCVSGNEIILKEGNTEIKAKIVDKPFYRRGTAKMSCLSGNAVG
jgi:aminomethyltransferase